MRESGIVMEVSTETILFEKNMHDTHYPASTTKIMTVLLAIENCEVDEAVTVPPEALQIRKELSVTDLNIKFDYGGAETVAAQYFLRTI